jgi:3'-5' exoribonuclease
MPSRSLLRLRDLEPGQQGDFFALLAERVRGVTREGKPYYTCRFRDASRVVTCMIWADSPQFEACEAGWREGMCFKLRATYNDHERFGPQIELSKIREAGDRDKDFDPGELVETTRFDRDEMFAKLLGLVERHIDDLPLRRLVTVLLERHKDRFKRLPATQNKFHPFAGGLLEHTLTVTQNCLYLADRYRDHYPDLKPLLNRDLVIAAAALHDLGRVAEFSDELLTPQATVPGRLLGHLFLGRDLVRDAARELGDVNPELLQMLEHLIISHLTLPEWGSPRLPLIPECLILHHADDLDAKLEMYVRCLTRDDAPGPFTDRDPILNRQLFKGRTV